MALEQERLSLGFILSACVLLAVGVLTQFYHLGEKPLDREAPARVAVYAREMNLSRDWLAPELYDVARTDVSPLNLWFVKLAAGLSPDRVSAFGVRLPGAVCGLGIILLSAGWFYSHARRYGRPDMADAPPEGFALLAGLMIATNPVLLIVGRSGTPDAMVALAWLGTAFCWSESLEARRSFYAGRPWRHWILIGYALAGLGVLIRGPLMLVLLGVPYLMATHSYRLRRPDYVHAIGIAIALAMGAWWPALVQLADPAADAAVWRQWIWPLPAVTTWGPLGGLHCYLGVLLLGSLPWCLPGLVMAWRAWFKYDRSPTLVYWLSSFLGTAILLGAYHDQVGSYVLIPVIFLLLLAADAFYRWNFESRLAQIWRRIMRTLSVLAIVAGVAIAVVINSDLGLVLFFGIAVFWVLWRVNVRRYHIQYSPWERTVRLAAVVVLVFAAAEGTVLKSLVPRAAHHSETLGWFARIRERVQQDEVRYYTLDPTPEPGLREYHLGGELRRVPTVDAITTAVQPRRVLLDPAGDPDLRKHRRLTPLTWAHDWSANRLADRAYEVDARGGHTLRVALLGNTGTRSEAQRAVAKRLRKFADDRPVDDVVLLGNNVYGPSEVEHLSFVASFEHPYRRLLDRGFVFHATLGHEDQNSAWAQVRYPPFHMAGRRYYARTLGAGLLEVFVLDSDALVAGEQAQWTWLERALATSRAPWRMIALYRAPVGASRSARPAPSLERRLLPLAERHGVNLIAWAGGRWYERWSRPAGPMVMIQSGHGGGFRNVRFNDPPGLAATYANSPGFVLLTLSDSRAELRSHNADGVLVDSVFLNQVAARPAEPEPWDGRLTR